MPPGLFQYVLTVLVFWSCVLLLPQLPPSSRSLRLFPGASILLHGPLDICLDLLPTPPPTTCAKTGRTAHVFTAQGGIRRINSSLDVRSTDVTPQERDPGIAKSSCLTSQLSILERVIQVILGCIKELHAFESQRGITFVRSPRPGRRSLRARKPQKNLEKILAKVLGPSGPKSLKEVSRTVRKISKISDSPREFFLVRLLGPEGPSVFPRLLGLGPGDSSSQAGEILQTHFPDTSNLYLWLSYKVMCSPPNSVPVYLFELLAVEHQL